MDGGGIYLNTFLGGAAQAAGFTPNAIGVQQFLGGVVVPDILSGSTSFANAVPGGAATVAALHQAARANANANMLMPGTAEFDAAVSAASDQAILSYSDQGALGALIKDVSEVYTFEANYDFEDKIDFANLIVGGLYRDFKLDTDGTLYTDRPGDPITYSEYGAYAQMQKDLLGDDLSVTASMRYDKQSVMEDANVTPRLGLLYKLSDKSNVRISAQVGYRNPTNQDKFIGLYNGEELLLGTTEDNIDRFDRTLGAADFDQDGFAETNFNWTGDYVFNNALNKSAWDNGGNLVSESLDFVEAEKVVSYDIGYRYNSKDFTLDMNAYYSQYENFIGTNSVYVPAAEAVALAQSFGLVGDAAVLAAMDPSTIGIAGPGAYLQFGMDANLGCTV